MKINYSQTSSTDKKVSTFHLPRSIGFLFCYIWQIWQFSKNMTICKNTHIFIWQLEYKNNFQKFQNMKICNYDNYFRKFQKYDYIYFLNLIKLKKPFFFIYKAKSKVICHISNMTIKYDIFFSIRQSIIWQLCWNCRNMTISNRYDNYFEKIVIFQFQNKTKRKPMAPLHISFCHPH